MIGAFNAKYQLDSSILRSHIIPLTILLAEITLTTISFLAKSIRFRICQPSGMLSPTIHNSPECKDQRMEVSLLKTSCTSNFMPVHI